VPPEGEMPLSIIGDGDNKESMSAKDVLIHNVNIFIADDLNNLSWDKLFIEHFVVIQSSVGKMLLTLLGAEGAFRGWG
jgi:hypothetical protein